MIAEGLCIAEINAIFCDSVGVQNGPFSFLRYKEGLNSLMSAGQVQWAQFRLPQAVRKANDLLNSGAAVPATPEEHLTAIYLGYWNSVLRKHIAAEVAAKYSASSVITDETLHFLYNGELLQSYLRYKQNEFKGKAHTAVGSPELEYVEKPLLQAIDASFDALAKRLNFDRYAVLVRPQNVGPIFIDAASALNESAPMACFNGSPTLTTLFYNSACKASTLDVIKKKLNASIASEGSTRDDLVVVSGLAILSNYTNFTEYLYSLYGSGFGDHSGAPVWIIQSRGRDNQSMSFYVAFEKGAYSRISGTRHFIAYFKEVKPPATFGNLFAEEPAPWNVSGFKSQSKPATATATAQVSGSGSGFGSNHGSGFGSGNNSGPGSKHGSGIAVASPMPVGVSPGRFNSGSPGFTVSPQQQQQQQQQQIQQMQQMQYQNQHVMSHVTATTTTLQPSSSGPFSPPPPQQQQQQQTQMQMNVPMYGRSVPRVTVGMSPMQAQSQQVFPAFQMQQQQQPPGFNPMMQAQSVMQGVSQYPGHNPNYMNGCNPACNNQFGYPQY